MTNTKPNFIYKFEKINSTQEEKEQIIFEFIKLSINFLSKMIFQK